MPSYTPPSSTHLLSPQEREQRYLRDWLMGLEPNLRPFELFKSYPKIAHHIVAVWGQPAQCNAYLDQIVIANRSDRQGFPAGVADELLALSSFYKDKYANLIGLRHI